jgi:PleD family two-component response regulator
VCPPHEGTTVLARLRASTPSGQTCSAGIAYWDWAESPEALVRRADAALYEAKRGGRDRAVVAGDPG